MIVRPFEFEEEILPVVELSIGERAEIYDITVEAVEFTAPHANPCHACEFDLHCDRPCCGMACFPEERTDGKTVVFRSVQ